MTGSDTCASAVCFQPSRTTGKERDAESGNDYFEARYYSSSMGRFMSPDWSAKEDPVPYAKMDDPQSLNLYAYVMNNPLVRVDPDGHGCNGWGCLDGQQQQTEAAKDLSMTEAQHKAQQQGNGNAVTKPTSFTYNFASDLVGLSPNVQFNSQSSRVHPEFTPDTTTALNSALTTLNSAGVVPTLNSAFRTFADQDRMRSGGSGTRPAALFSWHEAGNAVDIQPGRNFPLIRSVMQQNGFTWGGNWRGNQYDPVHFELQRPHGELFIDILRAQAAWGAQHQ